MELVDKLVDNKTHSYKSDKIQKGILRCRVLEINY